MGKDSNKSSHYWIFYSDLQNVADLITISGSGLSPEVVSEGLLPDQITRPEVPEQLLQSRLIQIQRIIAGARLVGVPFPQQDAGKPPFLTSVPGISRSLGFSFIR